MVSRPTPAVLHACRESRNEFIGGNKHPVNVSRPRYRPFFEDDNGKKVFFSFEVDALHLMDFSMLSFSDNLLQWQLTTPTGVAEPLVKKQLRYLVVGGDMPPPNTKLDKLISPDRVLNVYADDDFENPKYAKITMFKNLEILVVVCFPHHTEVEQEVAHVRDQLAVVKQRAPEYEIPLVLCKKLVGQIHPSWSLKRIGHFG
jgi:hypothetical protein